MEKEQFVDFLKSSENESDNSTNIDKEVTEYKQQVCKLLENVEDWISGYSDYITYKRKKITINEDLAEYETEELLLTVNKKSVVTLEPVGTFVVGAKGCVDLIGPRGTVSLVLCDKRLKNAMQLIKSYNSLEEKEIDKKKMAEESANSPVEYVWKIYSEAPDYTFKILDENTFTDCIKKVLSGSLD